MIPKSNSHAVTLNGIVIMTGNKADTHKFYKSVNHDPNGGYSWWMSSNHKIGDRISNLVPNDLYVDYP